MALPGFLTHLFNLLIPPLKRVQGKLALLGYDVGAEMAESRLGDTTRQALKDTLNLTDQEINNLLEHPKSLNRIDKRLGIALRLQHPESDKNFFKAISDARTYVVPLDTLSATGRTPLMEAASAGNTFRVGALCCNKANVDRQDEDDNTALMFVAKVREKTQGHSDVAQYLLDANANTALTNHNRRTAADMAQGAGGDQDPVLRAIQQHEAQLTEAAAQGSVINAAP